MMRQDSEHLTHIVPDLGSNYQPTNTLRFSAFLY